MINIGTLFALLKLQDEMTPALRTAGYQLTLFGRGMRETGALATAGLTVPLVGAAVASHNLSAEFELLTTQFVSLGGVAKDELAGVRKSILELAPIVGIMPQELAEGMMRATSTTRDTGLALEILKASAYASAAGMGKTNDVVTALSAITNSYGKEAITAAQAADVLTKAVQDGGAEAKELAPTLANVVPFAAQMGVSFQEVAANFSTVTKLGVPASEAITMLTSVMAGMTRENSKGVAALNSLAGGVHDSISSYAKLRQEVKEKGLAETLLHLNEAFHGQEKAVFSVVGRIEGYKNILAVTGAQAGQYREEVVRMNLAYLQSGTLMKAFEEIQKTQAQTWNELRAKVAVIGITLGDGLAPAFHQVLIALQPVMEWVLRLAQGFTALDDTTKFLVITFFALVAALGPVLIFFGQMFMAVGNLARAIPTLVSALVWLRETTIVVEARFALLRLEMWAMTTAGGALGLVLTALAGTIAVVATAWTAWEVGKWIGEISGMTVGIEFLTAKLLRFLGVIDNFSDADLFNSVTAGIEQRLKKTSETAAITAESFDNLKNRVSGKDLVNSMYDLHRALLELTSSGEATPLALQQIANSANALKQQGVALTPALEKAVEDFDKLRVSSRAAAEPIMTLSDKVKNLTEDQKAHIESLIIAKYTTTQIAAETKIASDVVGLYSKQVKASTAETSKFWKEADALGKKTFDLDALFKDMVTTAGEYTMELAATKAEVARLTETEKKNILAGLALGNSQEVVAKTMNISKQAVRLYKEESDDATAAMKRMLAESDKLGDKTFDLDLLFKNMSTQAGSFADSLRATRTEVSRLTKEQKENIDSALIMGVSIKDISKELDISEEALQLYVDGIKATKGGLKDLAGAFSTLSQILGESSDGFFKWAATVVGAMELASQAGKNVKTGLDQVAAGGKGAAAGFITLAAGAMAAASAMMEATQSADKTKNAIGGMTTGFQIGNSILPGWGGAIGAIAGGIFGLIRASSNAAKQAAEDARKLAAAWIDVKKKIVDTYGDLDSFQDRIYGVGLDFIAFTDMSAAGLKNVEQAMKLVEERMGKMKAASDRMVAGLSASTAVLTEPWIKLGKELEEATKKSKEAIDAYDKAFLDPKTSEEQLAKLREELFKTVDAEKALMNQIGLTGVTAKQTLADLGTQSIATFAAVYMATGSYTQAIAAVAPAMTTLQEAYTALGLNVDNVALKHLMLQSTVLTSHPALMAAIDGQAGALQGMAQMGLLNADTFAAMQRTGTTLYEQLQAATYEAALASGEMGDVTRDALLPMQGYLQQAAEQSRLLGIPLDENTQRMIDQSKELGIWKEKGKSANDLMIEGINTLIGKLDVLLEKIFGMAGALTNLPSPPAPWNDWPAFPEIPDYGGQHGSDAPDWGGAQANGGDYLVNKPTLFLAGEAGSERATFSPQNRSGGSGNRGPMVIQVMMPNGRVLAEAVVPEIPGVVQSYGL